MISFGYLLKKRYLRPFRIVEIAVPPAARRASDYSFASAYVTSGTDLRGS